MFIALCIHTSGNPTRSKLKLSPHLSKKHIVSALALYGAINLLLGGCSLMQAGWEECNAQPIIQAGLPNGCPLIQTLGLT